MFSAFVRRDQSQQASAVAADGDVRVWGLGKWADSRELVISSHTDFCLVQVTACSASQEDDWEGALEWRVQG